MRRAFLTVMAVALGSLSGCGGDSEFQDLKAKLAAIDAKPKGAIEPPPEFESYRTFLYSAASLRSPFQPPIEIETVSVEHKRSSVKPDENRPPEPLEDFGLESLSMVGTLKRPSGKLFALVRSPDGGLHRVQPGNYLGKNHGKVKRVDPIKIDVLEIVSDGVGGWVERPRSIVLTEKD